jgi:hypothetical protein
MATDDATTADPIPCPPCSGSGKVISNLGGTPHEVDCPWCEGTRVYQRDHDAQARWRENGAEPARPAEPA